LISPYVRKVYQPIPSMPWPVTAAVVARDEQRCIRRCVDSVLTSAVDAVLVLDTGSTDRTLELLAGANRAGSSSSTQTSGWPKVRLAPCAHA
jgi:hypothetical protein